MNYRFAALLICTALLLSGCSVLPGGKQEENTTETMIVYNSLPLPNLFVDIPERFTETSSQFYDKYYIHENASIIITEDKEAAGQSAKDYSIKALTEYQNMTNSLENVTTDSLYAGTLYVQYLEFTYTVYEGDSPLSVMAGYCTDGQSMFIVTCKCGAEEYQDYRDEFLAVLGSVRIDRTPVQ